MKWYPYFKKLTITATVVVFLVTAISVGAWLTTYFAGGFLLVGILHWWSRNLGGPGNRRAFLVFKTGFFLTTFSFPILLILYGWGVDKLGLASVQFILAFLVILGSGKVRKSQEKAWHFGGRLMQLGFLGAVISWIIFWFGWANRRWAFCPDCDFGQWFWLSLSLTVGLCVLGGTGLMSSVIPDLQISSRSFLVKHRVKGQRGRRAKPIEIAD